MTAEHQRERKPLRDNDLQTPLDFSGPPQKDAVERVFGTSLGEPLVLLFAAMWFATALHLAYLVRQAAEEIETPPTKDGVDG